MSDAAGARVEELQQTLRERDEQIRAIQRITVALGGIVKQQDLIRQALEVSLELVDASAGSIILYNEDRDKLVFTHVVGPTADELVGMELDSGQGIAGAVFRSGELRVSEDMTAEKEHDRQVGEQVNFSTKNMVTPVQTGAETLQFMLDDMFSGLASCPVGDAGEIESVTSEVREIYPEMISIILDGSTNVQDRTKEISDCIKGMISKPSFAPLDLNELVDRVVRPLGLVAESRKITLAVEPGEGLPPVVADEKQLYNAIYNLAHHALQACEEGATVTISTGAEPAGSWPDGDYAWLAVADTGSGIPDHVREKLFSDDAISTKPGGTGLGTRIIGTVVRAHGGTITVDSELGVGTTMTIRLPLTRDEG